MAQINTKTLTKEIAEEFNIPSSEVDLVMHSTFGFVRETITSEPDKSVRLKFFGIFLPKSKYKKNK